MLKESIKMTKNIGILLIDDEKKWYDILRGVSEQLNNYPLKLYYAQSYDEVTDLLLRKNENIHVLLVDIHFVPQKCKFGSPEYEGFNIVYKLSKQQLIDKKMVVFITQKRRPDYINLFEKIREQTKVRRIDIIEKIAFNDPIRLLSHVVQLYNSADTGYLKELIKKYEDNGYIVYSKGLEGVIRKLHVFNAEIRENKAVDTKEIRKPVVRYIEGEKGTGKTLLVETFAKVYKLKMNKMDIHVNQDIDIATLFGTTKGSFTDATEKDGYISSDVDLVVLDDIQYLDHKLQQSLNTLISTGTYTKVGDRKRHHYRGGIILISNVPLEKLLDENRLLPDFYDRLRGYEIKMPVIFDNKDAIKRLLIELLNKKGLCFSREVVDDMVTLIISSGYNTPRLISSFVDLIEEKRRMLNRVCIDYFVWYGELRKLLGTKPLQEHVSKLNNVLEQLGRYIEEFYNISGDADFEGLKTALIRYYADVKRLSNKEIAKRLGLSEATVSRKKTKKHNFNRN